MTRFGLHRAGVGLVFVGVSGWASGCGGGQGDAAESASTSSEAEAEAEADTSGDAPECVNNADCDYDYDCDAGECVYVPYCPGLSLWEQEIGQGPLDPYCTQPQDEPCWDSSDCDWGDDVCVEGICQDRPTLPTCDGPILTELPLPELDEQATLALAFVDFDADAVDELVLLRDGWLLVIDDQTSHALAIPDQLDRLTVAQLDDDGIPDLLLGQFGTPATHLVPGRADAMPDAVEQIELGELSPANAAAVDCIPGGTDEVVLTSADVVSPPVLVAQLAGGAPSVTPLDGVWGFGVAAADLFGDPAPELLFDSGCHAMVLADDRTSVVFDDAAAYGCEFVPAQLRPDAYDSMFVWVASSRLIVRLPFNGPREYTAPSGGDHRHMVAVGMPGTLASALLLLDPYATWTWSTGSAGPTCQAPAPELDGVVEVVSGDFDGDGSPELASLDALGVVRLWTAG